MLTVLSFLFKVLGCILLCVMLLLAAVVLLILFAPIKYRITGKKTDDAGVCRAIVTYLNPLFRLTFSYPHTQIFTVRVLGITVYPKRKKKSKITEQEQSLSQPTNPLHKSQVSIEETAEPVFSSQQKADSVHIEVCEKKHFKDTDESTEKKKQESEPKKQQTKEQKQDSTLAMLSQYAALLKENKQLMSEVLDTVLKACKTTLPKKCHIELVFGTGQPDTTGFLYAAFCSVSGYLDDVTVVPVWTKMYLAGECELKGKIRVFHLLTAFIKIKTNQEVKLLYKKIRSVAYGSKQ